MSVEGPASIRVIEVYRVSSTTNFAVVEEGQTAELSNTHDVTVDIAYLDELDLTVMCNGAPAQLLLLSVDGSG